MQGKVCLVLSAFIYGIAPLLAKTAYGGGVNPVTLTFLRTFLTLPLLHIIMRLRGQSFRLSPRAFFTIAALGLSGGTFTNLALYTAYSYISTGLATTLHFVYPLIILSASRFVYHEKIKIPQLIAAVMVTAGIAVFAGHGGGNDSTGIALALLSGVFYSFYVVYMDYSGIDNMDYIKLTFYLMIFMSAGTLVFGAATNSLAFSEMTLTGWVFSAFISILVTAFALPLFQIGVKREGAMAAGIISALEPITTLVIGAAFLGESMTVLQYAGAAVILAGVTMAERFG